MWKGAHDVSRVEVICNSEDRGRAYCYEAYMECQGSVSVWN